MTSPSQAYAGHTALHLAVPFGKAVEPWAIRACLQARGTGGIKSGSTSCFLGLWSNSGSDVLRASDPLCPEMQATPTIVVPSEMNCPSETVIQEISFSCPLFPGIL